MDIFDDSYLMYRYGSEGVAVIDAWKNKSINAEFILIDWAVVKPGYITKVFEIVPGTHIYENSLSDELTFKYLPLLHYHEMNFVASLNAIKAFLGMDAYTLGELMEDGETIQILLTHNCELVEMTKIERKGRKYERIPVFFLRFNFTKPDAIYNAASMAGLGTIYMSKKQLCHKLGTRLIAKMKPGESCREEITLCELEEFNFSRTKERNAVVEIEHTGIYKRGYYNQGPEPYFKAKIDYID